MKIMKKNNNDFFLNNICYHLQQCIEKELKYLIEITGERYEKIHDIFELADNCIEIYSKNNEINSSCKNLINIGSRNAGISVIRNQMEFLTNSLPYFNVLGVNDKMQNKRYNSHINGQILVTKMNRKNNS